MTSLVQPPLCACSVHLPCSQGLGRASLPPLFSPPRRLRPSSHWRPDELNQAHACTFRILFAFFFNFQCPRYLMVDGNGGWDVGTVRANGETRTMRWGASTEMRASTFCSNTILSGYRTPGAPAYVVNGVNITCDVYAERGEPLTFSFPRSIVRDCGNEPPSVNVRIPSPPRLSLDVLCAFARVCFCGCVSNDHVLVA